MTNLEMVALIVGFFSPPIIAIIQNPKWPSWLRATAMFLFAALVSVITLYFAGDLNMQDYVRTVLLVLVSTIATFQGFWKQTGITQRIEEVTSPGSVVVTAVSTVEKAVDTSTE